MIVDMLIAEIAAERGEDPKDLKDKLVRKIEEEKRTGAEVSASAHRRAAKTHTEHGIIANERKR